MCGSSGLDPGLTQELNWVVDNGSEGTDSSIAEIVDTVRVHLRGSGEHY